MFARMRRARRQDTVELNITAFMNLMVALVPFLLITAVFTQLTIKELGLPDSSRAQTSSDNVKRGLSVIVRDSGLTLTQNGSVIQSWPKTDSGYNYAALGQSLAEIKNRNPAEDRITLLLEPAVPYDVLIQVMDTVHYLPAAREGVLVDMYPQISVGDAPPLEATP
ncbi:Biopolymer transport protein ExbD [Fontimonas thermophila]|uniref:Biopolymer transport protein ExbD n=1 Tax=Fontimonas thermophila TaxID=1076937 RepID=A0A1I2IZ58_9GAMM|nr:biopolymer transporter ExbD [Fontimonas thermophila]SFF47008.1 Biopolymer transport protein ExbD [Fontimonas thermophila]